MNQSGTAFLFFISLAVLFCNVQLLAQEGIPNTEFPIGTFVYSDNEGVFNSYDSTGMNHIIAEFSDKTVNRPNLLGFESNYSPENFVFYYSSGYYSKWEAENEGPNDQTGIKHDSRYGSAITYKGSDCWASNGGVEYTTDFITGPNYKQAKEYKLWNGGDIYYTARYRLAFTGGGTLPPETVVCTLKIVYGYYDRRYNTIIYVQLGLRELTVSELDSSWQNYDLDYSYQGFDFITGNGTMPDTIDFPDIRIFEDDFAHTGIEFRIDFAGAGRLYIDYINLFDTRIGKELVDDPTSVQERIREYCNRNSDWDNLIYWFAYEEPTTLDQYLPLRIVYEMIQNDSLIINKKPLATIIYPH